MTEEPKDDRWDGLLPDEDTGDCWQKLAKMTAEEITIELSSKPHSFPPELIRLIALVSARTIQNAQAEGLIMTMPSRYR